MPKDDMPKQTPAEIEGDIHRLKEMEKDTNPETRNRIDHEIDELRKEEDQVERDRRS